MAKSGSGKGSKSRTNVQAPAVGVPTSSKVKKAKKNTSAGITKIMRVFKTTPSMRLADLSDRIDALQSELNDRKIYIESLEEQVRILQSAPADRLQPAGDATDAHMQAGALSAQQPDMGTPANDNGAPGVVTPTTGTNPAVATSAVPIPAATLPAEDTINMNGNPAAQDINMGDPVDPQELAKLLEDTEDISCIPPAVLRVLVAYFKGDKRNVRVADAYETRPILEGVLAVLPIDPEQLAQQQRRLEEQREREQEELANHHAEKLLKDNTLAEAAADIGLCSKDKLQERLHQEYDFLRSNIGEHTPSSLPGSKPASAPCISNPQSATQLIKLLKEAGAQQYKGNPETPVRDWLLSLESRFTVVSFPVEYRVAAAKLLLQGKAEQYWLSIVPTIIAQQQDPHDWDVFKQYMYKGFGATDPEVAARTKIFNMQQGGMSTEEYVRKLQGLFSLLVTSPMSEADKVMFFVSGARPDIARVCRIDPVSKAPFTSFVEVSSWAIRHDATNTSAKHVRPAHKHAGRLDKVSPNHRQRMDALKDKGADKNPRGDGAGPSNRPTCPHCNRLNPTHPPEKCWKKPKPDGGNGGNGGSGGGGGKDAKKAKRH